MELHWAGIRNLIIVTIVLSLAACAVAPRFSTWDGPKNFTKDQVFNAALQAGIDNGMKTVLSDRQSGTISLVKGIGGGEMALSVRLVDTDGIVRVKTSANFHGESIAFQGLHEEIINNFHVYLFQALNIDVKENMSNVRISQEY